MWCENCQHETHLDVCELCGSKTEAVVPTDIFWCAECKTPIIRNRNDADKERCPLCNGKAKYLAADIRVVFPEERLLLELMLDKPLAYKECSVWANNSRYYIDETAFTHPVLRHPAGHHASLRMALRLCPAPRGRDDSRVLLRCREEHEEG